MKQFIVLAILATTAFAAKVPVEHVTVPVKATTPVPFVEPITEHEHVPHDNDVQLEQQHKQIVHPQHVPQHVDGVVQSANQHLQQVDNHHNSNKDKVAHGAHVPYDTHVPQVPHVAQAPHAPQHVDGVVQPANQHLQQVDNHHNSKKDRVAHGAHVPHDTHVPQVPHVAQAPHVPQHVDGVVQPANQHLQQVDNHHNSNKDKVAHGAHVPHDTHVPKVPHVAQAPHVPQHVDGVVQPANQHLQQVDNHHNSNKDKVAHGAHVPRDTHVPQVQHVAQAPHVPQHVDGVVQPANQHLQQVDNHHNINKDKVTHGSQVPHVPHGPHVPTVPQGAQVPLVGVPNPAEVRTPDVVHPAVLDKVGAPTPVPVVPTPIAAIHQHHVHVTHHHPDGHKHVAHNVPNGGDVLPQHVADKVKQVEQHVQNVMHQAHQHIPQVINHHIAQQQKQKEKHPVVVGDKVPQPVPHVPQHHAHKPHVPEVTVKTTTM